MLPSSYNIYLQYKENICKTQKVFFKNKFINKMIIKNILQIVSSKYLKNNDLMCRVRIIKYNAHHKKMLMPLFKDSQSVSHLVGHY